MIAKSNTVTWECPRCGLIHHILTQTCSCFAPITNSSTTNIASTEKETLYVQAERDYYTKKEEQEWRKALLDFFSIPNMGVSLGEHKEHHEILQKFLDLRTRFLSDK